MSIITKVFNKITGNKSGRINLYKLYDLGADCLATPISIDLDNDGKKEIVCSTVKGDIFVLNQDLTLKWKFKAESDVNEVDKLFLDVETSEGIMSTPKIFDINNDGKKEILFGTEQGKVFALDSSGNILWTFNAEGAIRGGINIFYIDKNKDVRIVFGSLDKHIYMLNSKGKVEKTIFVGVGIESTPVIFDDCIIVGLNNGEIRAYNILGKLVWDYKTNSKITSEAVPMKMQGDSDCFVIGSTNNSIYCFNGKGKLLWSFETTGSIYSKAIVADVNGDGIEEIMFGSADNKIHVLSPEGTEMWNFETGFWIIGPPVALDIDNDGAIEVIVGSYDNNVYFLNADGSYLMEYVPGISGIVAQSGSYSDIPTGSPGNIVGKKIWEYKAPGIVIGCCEHNEMIAVQTKEGKILLLRHEK
jgi:outer membrane protein assembly factor BamB